MPVLLQLHISFFILFNLHHAMTHKINYSYIETIRSYSQFFLRGGGGNFHIVKKTVRESLWENEPYIQLCRLTLGFFCQKKKKKNVRTLYSFDYISSFFFFYIICLFSFEKWNISVYLFKIRIRFWYSGFWSSFGIIWQYDSTLTSQFL